MRRAASTLRYYRSADATITTSDTELGTDSISALAAFGTSDQSIDLTAPSTAGTYYYGACVDSVADESSTSNNCSSALTVTVVAEASPDLVVSSTYVSGPRWLDAGATEPGVAHVKNQGSGRSGATTVRFYWSTDDTITSSDTAAGTASLDGLDVGGTHNLSIDVTVPNQAGFYYFGACVDAVSGESDTNNNCKAAGYREEVVPSDLTVSVSKSGANLVVGESFTLRVTVYNSELADAAATTLRYYRSTDDTITTSDIELGTDSVDAITKPSNSSSHSIDLTAPSNAGTYYYGACVDAIATESSTTNNCSRALKVTVDADAAPDLVISWINHSGGTLLVDASFTLNTMVKNQGSATSASTTLRYYRSTDDTITTSDTSLGTDSVGGLAKAGTSRQSIDLTAPSTAGTYYYGVCVDAVTDESVTSNNCSDARAVSVDAEPAPDLVITGLSTATDPVSPWPFSIGTGVKNQGSGSSDATTLRFYRSTDATITTADTEVGTAAVGGLAPSGTSHHTSPEFTRPSEAGTYYYGACVDVVADESDTTNNCGGSLSFTLVLD